jgi:hypothetical protein
LYEVNREDSCLESPVRVKEPCLVETSDAPSGNGTPACLISPEQKAFIVKYYGYTEDVVGKGWEVYWLENPDSKAEHQWTDPVPDLCHVGGDLLDRASEECELKQDCDPQVPEFSDGFLRHLPICGMQ